MVQGEAPSQLNAKSVGHCRVVGTSRRKLVNTRCIAIHMRLLPVVICIILETSMPSLAPLIPASSNPQYIPMR